MCFKTNHFKPILSRGFTIIELLAVISIMVIIVSFTIPAMQSSVKRTSDKLTSAKTYISVFEKARLEAMVKQSFVWVEIERLQELPERYRFSTWRSPDRTDGRDIEGGGFIVPTKKSDKSDSHLIRIGRPKVFEKISLDAELKTKDYYDFRDLEFNTENEARTFLVFSPKGVCFSPKLTEVNYGASRVAPNVANPQTLSEQETIPVPQLISISITQGKGPKAKTEYLRISGSTSLAAVADQSLADEFELKTE